MKRFYTPYGRVANEKSEEMCDGLRKLQGVREKLVTKEVRQGEVRCG